MLKRTRAPSEYGRASGKRSLPLFSLPMIDPSAHSGDRQRMCAFTIESCQILNELRKKNLLCDAQLSTKTECDEGHHLFPVHRFILAGRLSTELLASVHWNWSFRRSFESLFSHGVHKYAAEWAFISATGYRTRRIGILTELRLHPWMSLDGGERRWNRPGSEVVSNDQSISLLLWLSDEEFEWREYLSSEPVGWNTISYAIRSCHSWLSHVRLAYERERWVDCFSLSLFLLGSTLFRSPIQTDRFLIFPWSNCVDF